MDHDAAHVKVKEGLLPALLAAGVLSGLDECETMSAIEAASLLRNCTLEASKMRDPAVRLALRFATRIADDDVSAAHELVALRRLRVGNPCLPSSSCGQPTSPLKDPLCCVDASCISVRVT